MLHGLGTERLAKLMPDVIKTTSKEDLAPHVREGYLMLYIYLPATFGDAFACYVGPIVPSLLKVCLISLNLLLQLFGFLRFLRHAKHAFAAKTIC